MKLVLDANTLISGSLWQGPPSQLLEAVELGKVRLISSPDLLAEFARVLQRAKFADRLTAQNITADGLARRLAKVAAIVSPAPLPLPPALRDPCDLHVLACAVAAHADAMVTGDGDLLIMKSFQGIPILKVVDVLKLLDNR